MKNPLPFRTFPSACLLAFAASLVGGCVQEGHSADCGAGGRGSLAEEGCAIPIGGSCLSEEEFKDARPGRYEDDRGVERTVDDDWITYQYERPECDFECLTEEEFLDNRTESPVREINGTRTSISLESDWELYLEQRPQCDGSSPQGGAGN